MVWLKAKLIFNLWIFFHSIRITLKSVVTLEMKSSNDFLPLTVFWSWTIEHFNFLQCALLILKKNIEGTFHLNLFQIYESIISVFTKSTRAYHIFHSAFQIKRNFSFFSRIFSCLGLKKVDSGFSIERAWWHFPLLLQEAFNRAREPDILRCRYCYPVS